MSIISYSAILAYKFSLQGIRCYIVKITRIEKDLNGNSLPLETREIKTAGNMNKAYHKFSFHAIVLVPKQDLLGNGNDLCYDASMMGLKTSKDKRNNMIYEYMYMDGREFAATSGSQIEEKDQIELTYRYLAFKYNSCVEISSRNLYMIGNVK